METLKNTIILAIEIAREGREGRKVGTIFVISDTAKSAEALQMFDFGPLKGYAEEEKKLTDSDVRETIKELAQLDGAFLVSDDGIVISACRYINATSKRIKLPLGLGSRHMAAASITKETSAVAVVVSESSIVRVFDDGILISEIIPELWLLSNYSLHLSGPVSSRTEKEITVLSASEEKSESAKMIFGIIWPPPTRLRQFLIVALFKKCPDRLQSHISFKPQYRFFVFEKTISI